MTLVWLAGCRDPETTLALVEPPALLPTNADLPLVRELRISTTVDAVVTVAWTDGEVDGSTVSGPGHDHRVPIVGLRPDRTWDVTVDAVAGDAHVEAGLSFATDPLPDAFPDISVQVSSPDRMTPGNTLLGIVNPDLANYAIVLDPSGEVRWLWRTPQRILELQLGDDGTLLGNLDGRGLVELDWTGRIVHRWMPAALAGAGDVPVDVRRFHHDVQRLSDGRLLTFTSDPVVVPTFPVSYEDPSVLATDEPVTIDRVLVLDPDGAIVEEHALSDLLPLERLGYGSLSFGGTAARDWTHCSGVDASDDEDALLISSRHQDALVAVDRATGDVRWILANPANWPPAYEALRLQPTGPPFGWQYHQHAPEWDGDLVLAFDNGNLQASPWTDELQVPGEDNRSRIVAFRVDEAERTVALAWSFEVPGTRLFAMYMGDVDVLGPDRVLGLFAGVDYVDGVPLARLGLGRHLARVVEFAPATGEVVWDVTLSSRGVDAADGWNSYRAQRIPAW